MPDTHLYALLISAVLPGIYINLMDAFIRYEYYKHFNIRLNFCKFQSYKWGFYIEKVVLEKRENNG